MSLGDEKYKTFRYKLDDSVSELLIRFSNIHRYDSIKVFKEAWLDWCEINQDVIVQEEERLQQIGYTGDVQEKMFVASRYYYRKKNIKGEINREIQDDVEVKPKQKRSYVILDTELLHLMDTHISECSTDNDYKPSVGFDKFYEMNKTAIDDEIARLGNLDIDVYAKIKKTYKNRYFKLR